MSIAALVPFSTVDFPETLACVVFTRGCDLDCFYCHNRALLHPLIDGEKTLETAEVLDFLRSRRGLLEGVAVTGGEPALWCGLADFLRQARAMGYKTKLDTNGQHADVIKELLNNKLLDYIALDIKALAEDSAAVCGRADAFERAKETAELLISGGAAYELRTTLYPGMTETKLKLLFSLFPAVSRWRLNIYRRPERFKPFDAERLEARSLTQSDLRFIAPELLSLQPNAVFPQ